MKTSKLFRFVFVLFFYLFISTPIFAVKWEVGIIVLDGSGNQLSTTLTVYTFNSTSRTFEIWDSGTTNGNFGSYQVNGEWKIINAAFDISNNDTPNPTVSPLPAGGIICVRIGDTFYKLDYAGSGPYGDMLLLVNGISWGQLYNNTAYSINGPYTWTDNTITLKNDFGGDRDNSNTKGNINFNSLSLTNVGYTGVNQTRESRTFPHTVAGEDNQYVNSYYRKWRKFSELGYDSILVHLASAGTYTRTATYARKYDITYQNYFNSSDNGGTIKLNGTSRNSPYSTNFYEYTPDTLEAINTTRNNVYYTFDHWEFQGSNVGSSNPYNGYSPTGSGTLQAVFTHQPVNYYRQLTFNNTEYGHPVKLTWHKHDLDNSFVTQYAIWRVVKHNGVTGNPVQIGTVSATGATSYTFTDYDYAITNGYTNDLLHYDVRAYYNPNYSDPDYVAVFAQLYSINQNNNLAVMENAEKPTEYSISNYPNPFNPTTTVNYQLSQNGFVKIKVFDVLGKEVATLVNENKSVGYYNVNFDASKLTSGVYIYTMNVNGFVESKKMLLMK